jgi:hypothetical protein
VRIGLWRCGDELMLQESTASRPSTPNNTLETDDDDSPPPLLTAAEGVKARLCYENIWDMSGDDAQQLANCICIRRSLASLGCPEGLIAGATTVDELHELTMHYMAEHGSDDCDRFEWSTSANVIAPQGLCVDSGCTQ